MTTLTLEETSLKALTGHPETVRSLRKGIYTRLTGDGFLVWSQNRVYQVLVNDSLQIQLYNEGWRNEQRDYRYATLTSPTEEYFVDSNTGERPERLYNSMQDSIQEIATAITDGICEEQDTDLEAQIRKLLWKALQTGLQRLAKEADVSLADITKRPSLPKSQPRRNRMAIFISSITDKNPKTARVLDSNRRPSEIGIISQANNSDLWSYLPMVEKRQYPAIHNLLHSLPDLRGMLEGRKGVFYLGIRHDPKNLPIY